MNTSPSPPSQALPPKAKEEWELLQKLCDPSRNMKNYRERVQRTSPPIIPFLRKSALSAGWCKVP